MSAMGDMEDFGFFSVFRDKPYTDSNLKHPNGKEMLAK